MRFRLPKPLHGWRAFFGEIGIIVIGVLIALGAQQLVADWNWKRDVADSDQRISEELRIDLVSAEERLAITGCLEPRLAELRDELGKDRPFWPGSRATFAHDVLQSDFPAVYRTPNRAWATDAWQTAHNGETLSHFDRDRVAELASLYGEVSDLGRYQTEELGIATELGDLAFAGPMTASERRANMKLVTKLDALNSGMLFHSRLLLVDARRAGLSPDLKGLKESLDQQRSYRGDCVRVPARV
jgi:hypothetical protein